MRQASVGYHCPECVAQAAASSPHVTARRALPGGPLYVTYGLIGLNVLVYLISVVMDRRPGLDRFTFDWALYPPAVGAGEWWRLITGGFLHAGAIHIGMNMFVLYMIGGSLELAIGRARFLAVYAVGLVGGALGVVLVDPRGLTVGASGAIFGLFGLLAVFELARGINPLQSGLGPVLLLNLVFTFTIPGISVGGHVGGLLAGGLAGAVLFAGKRFERQTASERAVRLAGLGVTCLVLFALALAQANTIGMAVR